MSYFEVYNEKIHDLLIVKDEQNQKRLPVSIASFVRLALCFTRTLFFTFVLCPTMCLLCIES